MQFLQFILVFGLGIALMCAVNYVISLPKGRYQKPIETDRDMASAFAIADDNSLWLATHQAINELEKEVIETARKCCANKDLTYYHLAASEGVSMVRLRLIEKRNMALKETQDQLKTG